MSKINSEKSTDFLSTKIIRIVNFLGAIIFALALSIEGIQHLGLYFLVTIYFWIYIVFIYFEIRYYKLTQNNFLNYLRNNPLTTIGGILPILIYILYRTHMI